MGDSIEDMDVEVQYEEANSDAEFIVTNDNSDHEDIDSVSYDDPEIEVTEIPKNASNQKEMVQPDDVFSIDSIPDKESILKARIVINDEGKLKIQCLFCNKTQGNIVTHTKGNKCKLVYCEQLQELKDRLKYLQRQNRNRKYHEKNKELNNQKNRESMRKAYKEDPN